MTVAVGHVRRRRALLALMGLFTLGPGCDTLLTARLVTSPGHGVHFGLGAIVVASVVPKNRQARAMGRYSRV
jgi:MFS transporter, DHA1 family, inner membrane transport protein